MYFFKHKGKELCIDTTFSTRGGLSMMVQYRKRNSEGKIVEIINRPFLTVFATRNIQEGDEIRYDYRVLDLPLRELKKLKEKTSTTVTATDIQKTKTCDFKNKLELEENTSAEILDGNFKVLLPMI